MKRTVLFWIIAILITVASVVYQRMTGPTYPVRGSMQIDGNPVSYTLERSHSTNEDYIIKVSTGNAVLHGFVTWKRFHSNDSLVRFPMAWKGGVLYGLIPKQPPAGKVSYQVYLVSKKGEMPLTQQPVVIRFKGDVPMFILIPHIFFMFVMLLLSTRTGFEAFLPNPRLRLYGVLTLVFIFIGGMILGPITQKYAFGAYWTGIPFGHDLTDNKTLIALIAWVVAVWGIYRAKQPWKWVVAAAVITFVVFLIPHSVLGSEIDYTQQPVK